MKSKQLIQIFGLLLLLLMPVALAWAFTKPTANHPTEDVANTKHNLRANIDIALDPTKGAEICVFCHTPHGGQQQLTGQTGGAPAPLWNRALPPSDVTFTPYSSPNFDARGTTPGIPKGVSLACLSCHDGVIAFDSLINAPGSGGFHPNNRGTTTTNGEPVFGQGAFQGPIVDTTDNSFQGGPGNERNSSLGLNADGSPYTGGLDDYVSTGGEGPGSVSAYPFPNLGRDLTDDHPISMAIPLDDPQFQQVRDGAVADGSIWKLKRSGSGVSGINQDFSDDKRDVVRAYPTQGGIPSDGITQENAYIECASCHNPHTPRPSFLRIPSVDTTKQIIPTVAIPGKTGVTGQTSTLDGYPNAGSLLCLTCHQK
jgi:hypothetical protein